MCGDKNMILMGVSGAFGSPGDTWQEKAEFFKGKIDKGIHQS
jgi:hypothetical protein